MGMIGDLIDETNSARGFDKTVCFSPLAPSLPKPLIP
jgi:hypothetical protein